MCSLVNCEKQLGRLVPCDLVPLLVEELEENLLTVV